MTSFKDINAAMQETKDRVHDTLSETLHASNQFCQEVLKTLDSTGLFDQRLAEVYKEIGESNARLDAELKRQGGQPDSLLQASIERNMFLEKLINVLADTNKQSSKDAREANDTAKWANFWSACAVTISIIALIAAFVFRSL